MTTELVDALDRVAKAFRKFTEAMNGHYRHPIYRVIKRNIENFRTRKCK